MGIGAFNMPSCIRLLPLRHCETPKSKLTHRQRPLALSLRRRGAYFCCNGGTLCTVDPACLFALTLPAATGLKAQFPLIHRRCRVSCLIQPWKIVGLKLNKCRALPIPQAPAPVRYETQLGPHQLGSFSSCRMPIASSSGSKPDGRKMTASAAALRTSDGIFAPLAVQIMSQLVDGELVITNNIFD
jgi:hypothetical protein